jgi:hypothetical protein
MPDHSQILVVSRDQFLLQTRRLILGTYFQVEAAGRVSEAGSILSRQDFDIIVLCDTLSDSDCSLIADMVRNREPQPMLVSLLGPGNRHAGSSVAKKIVDGAPLQLLKECAEVLGYNLQSGKPRTFAA